MFIVISQWRFYDDSFIHISLTLVKLVCSFSLSGHYLLCLAWSVQFLFSFPVLVHLTVFLIHVFSLFLTYFLPWHLRKFSSNIRHSIQLSNCLCRLYLPRASAFNPSVFAAYFQAFISAPCFKGVTLPQRVTGVTWKVLTFEHHHLKTVPLDALSGPSSCLIDTP